jgi:hypothetical protein
MAGGLGLSGLYLSRLPVGACWPEGRKRSSSRRSRASRVIAVCTEAARPPPETPAVRAVLGPRAARKRDLIYVRFTGLTRRKTRLTLLPIIYVM